MNYATEKARVTYDSTVETQALVATVEPAGYTAELPRSADAPVPEADSDKDDPHGCCGGG